MVLAALILGCQPGSGIQNEETAIAFPTMKVATFTPTLGQPQTSDHTVQPSTPASSAMNKVAEGRILDFYWSSDSMALFYSEPGELWVYRIRDEAHKPAQATIEATSRTEEPALEAIPEDAMNVEVSRSGNIVIFLILQSPTPTVPPDVDGEYWLGSLEGEIWLAKDSKIEALGSMPQCIGGYIWSDDESKVIVSSVELPPCQEVQAWYIDVEDGSIIPLFSDEDYSETVRPLELSPSGESLLYLYKRRLYVMDLASLQSRQLMTSPANNGIWLDDDTLVVGYLLADNSPRLLGVINLDTDTFTDFLSESERSIIDSRGWGIFAELISPDHNWLAFAAGENPYELSSLWVRELIDFK
jgi:hypothetical protein